MISLVADQAAPGAAVPPGREEMAPHFHALWRRLACLDHAPAAVPQALGLTSCTSGEGVSMVAAQLARAAASTGQPVLLVDANLQRPCLHRLCQLSPRPGFAEALRDPSLLAGLIQPSAMPNLAVLTAAQADGSLAQVHDAPAFAALVKTLKRDFPLVLFDLPAIAQGSFTTRVARLLDGILLVVEAEHVCWEVVQREKELLVQAGAALLGAVLNKRRQYVPAWLCRLL